MCVLYLVKQRNKNKILRQNKETDIKIETKVLTKTLLRSKNATF